MRTPGRITRRAPACATRPHHPAPRRILSLGQPSVGFTSAKTAAKRDFVAAYVEAMRKAGLRVGLYLLASRLRVPAYWAGPVKDPEGWRRYVDTIHAQVRELCTNYGAIDVFWFDGCWPYDPPSWRAEELLATIRELQPAF